MDFTLSLTHFCETHGPKSVLCTQVLPVKCTVCQPPSPFLRAQSSDETLDTTGVGAEGPTARRAHSTPSKRRVDETISLPTGFSNASTTVESEPEPESPNIERHPLFKHNDTHVSPQYRYGRAQGETCASCSFSAPEAVADRLPSGAPGSVRADGKSKNGAPVFRSREQVCLGTSPPRHDTLDIPSTTSSAASSYPGSASFGSLLSHPANCHDHTLTYLTAKSPHDPETYSSLRASVLRALSCEQLPLGMSDGPICFGDATAGYTIAYVFRLTDPKARGRRRCYAFLALAGKDASRAFRACPMLWEHFASMAKGIEVAATRAVEEKERKEEEESSRRDRNIRRPSFTSKTATPKSSEKMAYTPVSSFLTRRAIEADGTIRRAGQTSPRSLADIVGDETIFAILHQYFVALLRCLGDRFGGVPLAGEGPGEEAQLHHSIPASRTQSSPAHKDKAPPVHKDIAPPAHSFPDDDDDATPTPFPAIDEEEPPTATTKQVSPTTTATTTTPCRTSIPTSKKHQQHQHHRRSSSASHSNDPPNQKAPTTVEDEIDKAKRRLSKTLSLGSSGACAPLRVTPAEVRGKVQVQQQVGGRSVVA